MKYRPSVSFLLCLLGIAVVEMEVIRTMVRGEPALEHVSADQATLDYLVKRKQPIKHCIGDEFAANVIANFTAGEEAKRKLLVKWPIFAFKDGDVPDKRNAYDPIRRNRELERLMRKPYPDAPNKPLATLGALKKPAAFRAMLMQPEYGDLMAKIEHLATLPPPSSPEETRERFEGLSQWSGRDCIGALLNKARLAAEAKNEAEALRLVEAAIRLSSHFDPLGQAVQFPFDPAGRELIQEMSLTVILRCIGPGADLPRWREMLAGIPAPSTSAWADNLREEWHRGADLVLVNSVDPANSARARSMVARCRRHYVRLGRLIALAEGDTSGTFSPPPRVLAEFYSGTNGYTRNLARRVRILAALDLLILEKSGVTLDVNSMAQISTGMLPGESPVFDPATRQISFEHAVDMQTWLAPIRLPW